MVLLLCREDLRELIKSFRLCRDVRNRPFEGLPPLGLVHRIALFASAYGSEFDNLLWSHVENIKKTIEDLTTRYNLARAGRTLWFARLFENFPIYDGALSLLLCLATQVVSIHLDLSEQHRLLLTQDILTRVDWKPSDPEMSNGPFSQLKTLTIAGTEPYHPRSAVAIHPSLEEVRLLWSASCSFFVPEKLSPTVNTL
jgi:hypothetical protein